jgi:hypothetical protein
MTAVPPTETAAPTRAASATQTPVGGGPEVEPDFPASVEVDGTNYVFAIVAAGVDPETLTEVEGVDDSGRALPVLVDPNVTGIAPLVYVVGKDGKVGLYQLAAATLPTPPAPLPPTITLDDGIYMFNEVEEEVDTRALQPVGLVTDQDESILVYAERGRRGRVFAVAQESGVAGQYVHEDLIQPIDSGIATPETGPGTPESGNVVTSPSCGSSESDTAQLPTTIVFEGVEYSLTAVQTAEEAGELTTIGCVGAYEVAETDLADRADVLYLRAGGADAQVYRYESS